MNGSNLVLPTTHDHHLDEGSVHFSAAPGRPLLGFDNLRTTESVEQQERLRSNLRPDVEHDVVIVGSGFVNEDGSDFLFGVQMNVGGRSVFWSGLIPRMREWELAWWPQAMREDLSGGGYAAAETVLRKRRTLGPFQRATVGKLRNRFPD
jgi:hypothetical protein